MKKLSILLALGATSLFLVGCTLPSQPTPTTPPTTTGTTTTPSVGACGLKISAPALNSAISSNVPVVFNGVIDNTDSTLGCTWTMFEGQAGTVQLYYKNGNTRGPIGPVVIIPVANWMTTGPEPFTVSVQFNNTNAGFQPGTLMKATFTEENPSGQTADTFDFPLILQ